MRWVLAILVTPLCLYAGVTWEFWMIQEHMMKVDSLGMAFAETGIAVFGIFVCVAPASAAILWALNAFDN